MSEKGGPVVGPWNFYWDSWTLIFFGSRLLFVLFTKHLVWIFFRMKMSFDFIHRCLHHLFFWRWCWRGIELLYSKPLLSDFMIYWSSLESYCTFASMFNEPFLTFISKLPPAKSMEQCGPNFTDGAVDCQPMERWKDDIGHWHWALAIWFLFNGFCHVQHVSEKQSTIFHKKTQSSQKKLNDWPSTIPFFVYTFGHSAACWWKIFGDSCSQVDTFVVLIGFGVS